MILNWLFRLLIPFWDDMVLNPVTGKASQKNVFQIFYGLCGVAGAGVAIWADVDQKRPVNTATIFFLLLAGLGLATAKIVQTYLNRKTQDEDGALAQPKPEPPTPPKLMPQEPELKPLAGTDYPSIPPGGPQIP